MSLSTLVVALVVFASTWYYMKRQMENEKRELAKRMLESILVTGLPHEEEPDNRFYKEVITKISEADKSGYHSAEQLLLNSISAATAYRYRDMYRKDLQTDEFLRELQQKILTPEQRELYWEMRDKHFPD